MVLVLDGVSNLAFVKRHGLTLVAKLMIPAAIFFFWNAAAYERSAGSVMLVAVLERVGCLDEIRLALSVTF